MICSANEKTSFDFEKHADNQMPYVNTVIFELKVTATELFLRFNNNRMKSNPDKTHLPCSNRPPPKKSLFQWNLDRESSTYKFLGIQIH